MLNNVLGILRMLIHVTQCPKSKILKSFSFIEEKLRHKEVKSLAEVYTTREKIPSM